MDYEELNKAFSGQSSGFQVAARSRTVQDFIFWMRNRAWLILLFTAVGAILGYYVHISTPRNYKAISTIEIEREEKATDIDEQDSSKAVKLSGSSIIATATDKILMRKHFIKMVENTDLNKNPNVRKEIFTLMPKGSDEIEKKGLSVEEVAKMARNWVQPQARKNSYLIDVTVEHTDPEIAYIVANELLVAYQQNLEEEVKVESDKNVEIVRVLVSDAESQLLKLSERLALYNACLVSQENIRKAELEILELKKRYGPKWPALIEANTKLNSLLDIFDQELDQVLTLSDEENEYWASLPEGIDKIQNVEARAHFLTAEVTNKQLLRDRMISKIDNEELGTKVTREFKVQNGATLPQRPVYLSPITSIAKYFSGGLLAGLLLVFAIGFLDPTLRSVAELEQIYGIPVLGAIPIHLHDPKSGIQEKKKSKDGRDLIPILTDRSPSAEAIRNLRSGLAFLGEKKDRRSFLVTSAVPGEGKSFVSSNVAVSFASQGDKTLLIDLDLRKPVQHTMVDLKIGPGVTDFIVSGMDIHSVIRPTGIKNFDIITAGTRSPHPSELMNIKNLNKLVDSIPEDYERIIIDSAPVLAVRDSLAPAKLVDSTVVVYKMGSTHLRAWSRLLRIYEENGSYPVGFVANSLPGIKQRGGYYGYYGNYFYGSYHYSYYGGGAYYGDEDEELKDS